MGNRATLWKCGTAWLPLLLILLVAGRLKYTYQDFGVDLPNTTQFIADAADWTGTYFYVGLPLLAGVIIAHAWCFHVLLERADNRASLKFLAAVILCIPVCFFAFCLIHMLRPLMSSTWELSG